jgi:dihydrofolate reductase
MTLRAILAIDKSNSIGWETGDLPWQIPEDLKYFKQMTSNQNVVMGTKTYLSLGRPNGLPNRTNFVLTSKQVEAFPPTVQVVRSLHFFTIPRHTNGVIKSMDAWVIGGAKVYNDAIAEQVVDEIYFTKVFVDSGADVRIGFDLFNTDNFIFQQSQLGVNWDVEYGETMSSMDGPDYSFNVLKKRVDV